MTVVTLCEKEIELRKIYEFELPQSDLIDDAGIEAVRQYLLLRDLPPLPQDWDWRWMVQKGPIAGNLTKRIGKYYFREHSLDVDKMVLEGLGNTARPHKARTGGTYYLDFTDTIDWNAGKFGDDGSCFWGGRSIAKSILVENGALAVRFYNKLDNGNFSGWGRAWVIPCYPYPESMVIFNGYGMDGNDPTMKIVGITSTWLNARYWRVNMLNNNTTTSKLYINGSGRAFIVDSHLEDRSIDKVYDLHWSSSAQECESCGRECGRSDAHILSGDVYCSDCYRRNGFRCYECSGEYHINNSWRHYTDARSRDSRQRLCTHCYDRHNSITGDGSMRTCDHCTGIMNTNESSNASHRRQRIIVCLACSRDGFICVDCLGIFLDNDTHNGRCTDCYDDYVTRMEQVWRQPIPIEDLDEIFNGLR